MYKFLLCTAKCSGDSSNCLYPNKTKVSDRDSFIKAISFDHVCGSFKGSYRSKDNFIKSDCIPMDCDNDHSDDPDDWVTPFDVAMAFPDVCFYASYSRNHMKDKGSKSARPRFHVYFPIEEIKDADEYADYKAKVQTKFLCFDDNALDAARFLYGTQNPEVELYEGSLTVTDYLGRSKFEDLPILGNQIQEGSRNSTLSHFAGIILKRYGKSEKAKKAFLEKSEKCNPPLDREELALIWNSAISFYEKISKQKGYVPPDE